MRLNPGQGDQPASLAARLAALGAFARCHVRARDSGGGWGGFGGQIARFIILIGVVVVAISGSLLGVAIHAAGRQSRLAPGVRR
ncbi:MAG: hypothetical protein JWM76_1829 [Pseudonocardiales bacterium]|nr:hypothetical protein [Pseudonocardiales bacterium]